MLTVDNLEKIKKHKEGKNAPPRIPPPKESLLTCWYVFLSVIIHARKVM